MASETVFGFGLPGSVSAPVHTPPRFTPEPSHNGRSARILSRTSRSRSDGERPQPRGFDMSTTGSSADRPRGPAMRRVLVLVGLGSLVLASAAGAQIPDELAGTPVPMGEGWSGFSNLAFILDAFLDLILAAVLGAVIGYHPRRIRTADTLVEIEAPKVSIVYAVIGSLIGILVVEYGLIMGFVLFGIGGLIRFRTVMRSAQLTGQVIFATLIGLTCGLHLPHVAVLATGFEFVLTFLLESRITYRVDVRGLPRDRFTEAADAYRDVLAGRRFRILSERKRPAKGRVCFIFRSAGHDTRQNIEGLFDENVDPSLRGSLDWRVD